MQPQNSDPKFDFLLKNDQPAKAGFSLPMPNLPKPVKIAGAVIIGLIVLIILGSLLSGRKDGKMQPFIGVAARGHEILRVTTLAQQQLKLQDPATQALASTASAALQSEQQQLITYLKNNHTTVTDAVLLADENKSTDASLQTAGQNNSLDAAYAAYLKDSLTRYESDIQTAYKTAGPNGKKILQDASDSTDSLLNSSLLKNQ